MWQIGHQMAISTHVSSLEPYREVFSYWDSRRGELMDARMFSDMRTPTQNGPGDWPCATWNKAQEEEALALLGRVASGGLP